LIAARAIVVREQVPARVVERRARQQRDLRVAVDEDLFQVVVEFVPGQRVLADERRVPVRFRVFREIEEAFLLEIVADEVRLVVDDELSGQRASALIGHTGGGRLGVAHVEERAEDVVHRDERGRHARARRQKPAPAHAVTRAQGFRELLHPRLDALLLPRLGQRVELAVRHDLGRDR
jgi:hypothetical protein